LDVLINTHLHSDHCGGNSLLQNNYVDLQILVPSTQFAQVNAWDEDALTFQLTGQLCPIGFTPQDLLFRECLSAYMVFLGQHYASKGHDDDSLIFFQPEHGILISADALWENGFSVVFPEFLGGRGFEEVSQTYDLIESLHPKVVVPGHGAMFNDVHKALSLSRQRLEYFQNHPVLMQLMRLKF
jgi:glyoxylase-like metal-dependent hydrolase (beta-lactamase superfamily II)